MMSVIISIGPPITSNFIISKPYVQLKILMQIQYIYKNRTVPHVSSKEKEHLVTCSHFWSVLIYFKDYCTILL